MMGLKDRTDDVEFSLVPSIEVSEEISRSVSLTNEQWATLALCAESYADTYRKKHSQTIATYVTRGQIPEAQAEAVKMNQLLQTLDKLQAKLV
jgi:hypothetical protein